MTHTITEPQPMPEKMLVWLERVRPDFHSWLLNQPEEKRSVRIHNFDRRTGLEWPSLPMPANRGIRDSLDRTADGPDRPYFVIDGSLEDNYSDPGPHGRLPYNGRFEVGEKVFIDPKLLHCEACNCGPHSESREAEVTVQERTGYMITLAFEDGHTIQKDCDELRAFNRCWLPVTPEAREKLYEKAINELVRQSQRSFGCSQTVALMFIQDYVQRRCNACFPDQQGEEDNQDE